MRDERRTIWEYEFFLIDYARDDMPDPEIEWPVWETVEPILKKLNEIGADGWEAFRIIPRLSKATIWAKRPKIQGEPHG